MAVHWLLALVAGANALSVSPAQPAGALQREEASGFVPEKCPAFIQTAFQFRLPTGAEFIAHLRAQKEEARKALQSDTKAGVHAPADNLPHITNLLAAQPDANVSAPPGYPRDLYTKCQKPTNLSYCTEVDWAVPFYGWVEWGQYQEQCLMYYIDYYYKDKKMAKECVTAMKNIGCASYFPKCSGKKDAEGRDTYLKPCRHMCEVWKDDLACPGSEKLSCLQGNMNSISFSRYGDCTEYPPIKVNASAAQQLPPVAPAVAMVEPKKAQAQPQLVVPKAKAQQQQQQQEEEEIALENLAVLKKKDAAGGLSPEAQFELEKGDVAVPDKMKAAEDAGAAEKKLKLA